MMSVDLEDWFCGTNVNRKLGFEWEKFPLRVETSTRQILKLFNKYDVKATFFVLGYIAERAPSLIKEIRDKGHEIASHGYKHRLLTEITEKEFENDIEKALESLTKCDVNGVIGYRAPSFTITHETIWALDILKKFGFKYDSSVYPVKGHPDYGMNIKDSSIFKHENGILEIPLTSVKFGKLQIPVSGGAYFRFYPYLATKKLLAIQNRRESPFIFYLHPWEIDTGQPTYKLGFQASLRHYHNISKTEQRLERLLQDFKFTDVRSYLRSKSNYDKTAET